MRVGCGCFVYILFVFPLMLIFILLAGINTWVLDRGFYEESFSDPAFFEAILEQGSIDWSATGLPQAFGNVPPFALDAGLRAVITPEHLQAMARSAVSGVFDMIEGNTDRFTFTFDLTPIQAALSGDGATVFANAYVGALPQCPIGQSALAPGSSLPVCIEAGTSQETLVSQVETAIPAIAEALPSEFAFEQEVELPDVRGLPLSVDNVRSGLTYAVITLGAVAVFLWFVDGFILGRDARNRFLWLGLTLLIPAGLVLLVGIGLNSPTLEATIRDSVLRSPTVRDTELTFSLVEALFSMEGRVRTGFLIAGGIPTLISVVLLIFGLVIRPSDKRKNNGHYVQVPAR